MVMSFKDFLNIKMIPFRNAADEIVVLTKMIFIRTIKDSANQQYIPLNTSK